MTLKRNEFISRLFTLLSIIAAGVGFASCGGSSGGLKAQETHQAPKIVEYSPAIGASDIEAGTLDIVITFDRVIKCPASKHESIKVSDGAVVKSVTVYHNSLKVSLEGLEGGKTYTLLIPAGTVVSSHGNDADEIKYTFSVKGIEVPIEMEPIGIDIVDDGNSAWQMMKKLGLGFNLGNQMDAYSNGVANETAWGNRIATQQTFYKLKSHGFSSVRIPITWLGHIGDAPEYQLDKAWLDRAEELVGFAEKAGLICIINTHHDEENNDDHWLSVKKAAADADVKQQITEQLTALWTQVAERFKDKGDFLIFEPFNELQDGGWGWSEAFRKDPTAQTGIINEWNQAFVEAVRATGGGNASRWLGVAGYAASSTIAHQYLELPKDSAEGRLMVGFHSYDPFDYCIKRAYNQWGHTRRENKDASELDEKSLVSIFEPYYTKYVSKGIPVYIGEFGCVNRKTALEQAFQKYYLEFFVKAARTFGMSAFLWNNGVEMSDTGEPFGFIDHGTGEFVAQGEALVNAMVKAMSDNSGDYTLETVFNSAP